MAEEKKEEILDIGVEEVQPINGGSIAIALMMLSIALLVGLFIWSLLGKPPEWFDVLTFGTSFSAIFALIAFGKDLKKDEETENTGDEE